MSGLVIGGSDVEEWVPALDGAHMSRAFVGGLPRWAGEIAGLAIWALTEHVRPVPHFVVGTVGPGHVRVHFLGPVPKHALEAAWRFVSDRIPMDTFLEITARPLEPSREGPDRGNG